MDNKTMTIVGVVIVAVIAIAGVAFFMMNNNSSEKDYNAQEVANNFIKNYDGTFGTFTIANSDNNNAELKATVKCYLKDGTVQKNDDGSDKTRSSMIKIIHYDTKEAAAADFDKYISSGDAPYESKNGSKGKTILSQVNPVGMAKDKCTVLNGTKNITVTAEGADVKTVKASDYGADQIYLLYGAFYNDTNAQFTLSVGVILDGKNIIIFNQTSNTGYGLYLNKPVKEDADAVANEPHIPQADFETALKNFCKAF